MTMHRLRSLGLSALLSLLLLCALPGIASAATPAVTATPPIPSDFNLQVTPSPLVTTVTPGVKSQVELRIHNNGSGTELLQINPRSFTLSNDSTNVKLQDTSPPDIGSRISFSAPKFTLDPGAWQNEEITFNLPKDTGFSYSFALVITRQKDTTAAGGTRAIHGSLAVFTLVNVDKPGAKSNLSIDSFSASKRMYEYLPATFSIRFRNGGNTIAQPLGNLFIDRGGSDSSPLATLAVNAKHGYILPDTSRTITANWSDGFPVYKTVTSGNGSSSQKLIWNYANISKLRIGRYTAHLVAVYNQDGHDVPIEGTVSFWVIPWKILLVLLLVILLVLFAIFVMVRAVTRFVKKRILKTKKPVAPAATDAGENKE